MDIKEIAEELGLEEDEFMELIDLFIETSAKDIDRLESAIMNEDPEGIVIAAHSLKGASANLGLMDFSETAKTIEFKGRNNNFNKLDDEVALLKTKLQQIAAEPAEISFGS